MHADLVKIPYFCYIFAMRSFTWTQGWLLSALLAPATMAVGCVVPTGTTTDPSDDGDACTVVVHANGDGLPENGALLPVSVRQGGNLRNFGFTEAGISVSDPESYIGEVAVLAGNLQGWPVASLYRQLPPLREGGEVEVGIDLGVCPAGQTWACTAHRGGGDLLLDEQVVRCSSTDSDHLMVTLPGIGDVEVDGVVIHLLEEGWMEISGSFEDPRTARLDIESADPSIAGSYTCSRTDDAPAT